MWTFGEKVVIFLGSAKGFVMRFRPSFCFVGVGRGIGGKEFCDSCKRGVLGIPVSTTGDP